MKRRTVIDAQAQRIREQAQRERAYDAIQMAWSARKAAFVEQVWRYMIRDMSLQPLYGYVQPSNGDVWGELHAVCASGIDANFDSEENTATIAGVPCDPGWELIAAEPIPSGDRVTIARWLARFADRLPVLPTS